MISTDQEKEEILALGSSCWTPHVRMLVRARGTPLVSGPSGYRPGTQDPSRLHVCLLHACMHALTLLTTVKVPHRRDQTPEEVFTGIPGGIPTEILGGTLTLMKRANACEEC